MLRISPLENGDQAVTLRLEAGLPAPGFWNCAKPVRSSWLKGARSSCNLPTFLCRPDRGVVHLQLEISRNTAGRMLGFVEEQLKGG